MYYNIKIKTKDAELVLESSNSSIVQREMDVYFSCLFDVSCDFKSRIKKVEIKDNNLFSIEGINNNKELEETPKEKETEKEVFSYVDKITESEIPTIEDFSSKINLEPQIESPIEPKIEPINEPMESQFELQIEPEVESQTEAQINALDELFDSRVEESEIPFISIQPQTQEESQVESVITELEPIDNSNLELSIEQEPLKDAKEINLDFKLFLAGFMISDLSNEFLACAYYIKNILKQDGFSMKTINSYLFQAARKIADMSTVSDLVERGFILHDESQEINKYAITASGEEYFKNKYQV